MNLWLQVDKYKYLVWAPGNCASVRLALQLASDAAVLKVSGSVSFLSALLYVGYITIVQRPCSWWSQGGASSHTAISTC